MRNILVIGSGGREHAIAWKLNADNPSDSLYCLPGNGGTSKFATNVNNIDSNNFDLIYDFVLKKQIDTIIVGPEGPLDRGIVDFFKEKNIKIFGPDKFASQLESSKLFARDFMKNNSIPQPKYFECSDIETAHSIKNNIGLPLVLKADGLAAGKGVIICSDEEEFLNGIDVMFNDKKFGDACSKISIEECLVGEEVSVFAVCDGNDFLIIGNAQDHKRAFDGDMGPNTGGMGAYSPTNICDDELLSNVSNNIITPTLNGMSKLGHPYVGFLYIGLMIVDGLPYVIEFNVRMGDPETQVVIPRIQSSLLSLFDSCFESDLKNFKLDVNDRFHVTVVLASDGYPESYKQGQKILGIDNLDDGLLFHAGTKFINGEILVSGGRVLNMIGVGGSLNEAIDDVYEKIKNICYSGMTYRKDIGQKGLK
tara:strand:+ start:198 stop:1463 length:1266 start_codon:yes stop_codon:yes gene_type:complete